LIIVSLIALAKERAIKLKIDYQIMKISLINLQTQIKFSWDFKPESGWALPTLNPYILGWVMPKFSPYIVPVIKPENLSLLSVKIQELMNHQAWRIKNAGIF
jgi:hypothetical protein